MHLMCKKYPEFIFVISIVKGKIYENKNTVKIVYKRKPSRRHIANFKR